jgi:NAD(P)-dependent dehydrogenase (short-subunit alcohol dehydrogenase family)
MEATVLAQVACIIVPSMTSDLRVLRGGFVPDLSGRAAIITGASRGLGAAIADRFLAANASVMLCARGQSGLEARLAELSAAHSADRVAAHRADIARELEVDELFAAATRVFGRIHILVNNAAVVGPIGPFATVDWKEWADTIAVNLTGTAYCARKALELFKPHRYGKIINISGGGASEPLPRMTAYAICKAAIARLTETLALEVKDQGVDVNAVAPGPLATQMFDQMIAAGPDRIGAELYALIKKLKLEGATRLELGAELCSYLASADADGVSGRIFAARWDPWPLSETAKHDIAETDIYTLRRILPKDRGKEWG